MSKISFTLSGAAPGKPRMTQRDKWKKRPCVVLYRHWCDRLRAAAPALPQANDVEEIHVLATYVPPASWSGKKRAAAIGCKKRCMPDGDNILKAVCDALWERDEALGDKHVARRWGERDELCVTLEVNPAANNIALTSTAPIFVSTNPPTALGCAVSTTHFQRGRVCRDGKGATP